jgi:hypothetical protein
LFNKTHFTFTYVPVFPSKNLTSFACSMDTAAGSLELVQRATALILQAIQGLRSDRQARAWYEDCVSARSLLDLAASSPLFCKPLSPYAAHLSTCLRVVEGAVKAGRPDVSAITASSWFLAVHDCNDRRLR